MSKFLWALGAFFICLNPSLPAQEQVRDPNTGKSFPAYIKVGQHNLKATGVATRKKLFIKVYSVAHYMEDPKNAPFEAAIEEILTAKKIKQLNTVFLRDVPVDKVQDSYRDSLGKALSATELGQYRQQIDQFLGFFNQPFKNGDTQSLRWRPDGTVDVEINGQQVGTVTGEGFARGLWSVWFGKSAVVNRKDLVSLLQ